MPLIQLLDVLARRLDPFVQHIGITALASGLVGQLPRKHRRRARIPRHHRLDIPPVRLLDVLVRVERIMVRLAVRLDIRVHPAIVVPVIHKVDDELDAVLLRRVHHIVQPLQSVRARVDGRFPVRVHLVVHGPRSRDRVDVVEAPDAQDLEPGLFHVVEDEVDVSVVGQEPDPVRVGAGEVAGFAVDAELRSGCAGECLCAGGGQGNLAHEKAGHSEPGELHLGCGCSYVCGG